MFKRREKRNIPGLNTTSTADISFMLLIFFLVTTSMESYKGLGRKLPPYEPDNEEVVQDINKDDIMTVTLTAENDIKINDVSIKLDDEFRRSVRHFIIEHGKSHIIEIQISRDANYDTYFHMQNQIVRAYKEIREAAAEKKFGTKLSDCDEEQREKIMKMYPQRLQEREGKF